jgi:DNA-binding MarR family transcriptional regulator
VVVAKKIPESSSRSAYLNLIATSDILHSDFAKLFRAHGITATVFNAMRVIIQGPKEGLPVGKVGAGLIQQVPDITRLLDRMERDGWVKRKRSKIDRRSVTALLTAEGKRKCETLYADVSRMHKTQLAHMSDRDLKVLAKLLEKARER